jgi:hypothetical protein
MADKKITDLPVKIALNGAEAVPIDDGATQRCTAQQIANLAPVQDHNSLTNLTAGDAHPQYHNDVRGDARYALRTTLLSPGNGLSGGGDLTANRTFTVTARATWGIGVGVNGVQLDLPPIGDLPESVDAANDRLLMYNVSESRPRLVSFTTALGAGSGFVPTARVINSGAGLTGGGDLSADRTLAVGAGVGITVNADDVALDTAHVRNVDHSAVSISAGTGLTGGGTITANRTLSLDTANSRNVDHSAVSITGTNSITGGGDISASRTLQLSGDAAAPGASQYYGTNGAGIKGWFAHSFGTLTGTASNAQIPVGAVTQHQASLSIGWGQITGTKNADQLNGFVANTSNEAANTIPVRNASGWLNQRVIQNVSGASLDGLYIGYGNAGGGAALTRLYGGGSTSANVTIDASGNLVASGNVTASSDERLKTDIEPIVEALDTVEHLRGVFFRMKTQDTRQVGVIAQEIERYLPEVVSMDENGYKTVAYANIVAVLIEAVKELSDKVRVLEAR